MKSPSFFPARTDFAAGARKLFPRGLYQPAGAYRFGLEALLLAGLALENLGNPAGSRRGKPVRLVELGCGCAATLFALGIARANLFMTGIEKFAPLVLCARLNCAKLGFSRISIIQADLDNNPYKLGLACRGNQLVLANPPWRQPGEGRLPRGLLRTRAFTDSGQVLQRIMFWARELLQSRGRLCLILPPVRLPALLELAGACRFGLRKLRPVASFAHCSARLLLLTLQKDAHSDPEFAPPLVLHRREQNQTLWSQQALAFCPWLNTRVAT